MPNPLLPFFGLGGPANIWQLANPPGAPLVDAFGTPLGTLTPDGDQAGTSGAGLGPNNTIPSSTLPYGTLVIVEPVFAELKDSGGFDSGKNGPVGHRHFAVPWTYTNVPAAPVGQPPTPQGWQYFVNQLLGSTTLTTDSTGKVVVSATFPDSFHPTLPWLVCQEVTMTGDSMQGPDQYGRVQFRRALLKCKYLPLDFAEKIDTQVQFQSIPGHRWLWIGQDARIASATAIFDVVINANIETDRVSGPLVLLFTTNPPLGANPQFAQITLLLGQSASSLTTIMPRLFNITAITERHVATTAFTIAFRNLLTPLNNAISAATIQQTLVSTGSAANDQPNMAAMQNSSNAMLQVAEILNLLNDVSDVLASLPPPNADLQQIQQDIALINGILPTLQSNSSLINTLVATAQFPAGVALQTTVVIPFNSASGPNGDPSRPMVVQTLIQNALTNSGVVGGTVVVSKIPDRQMGYRIRMYPNMSIINSPQTALFFDGPVISPLACTVTGNAAPLYSSEFLLQASAASSGLIFNFVLTISTASGFNQQIFNSGRLQMPDNNFGVAAFSLDILRALLAIPYIRENGIIPQVQLAGVAGDGAVTWNISIPGLNIPLVHASRGAILDRQTGLNNPQPLDVVFDAPVRRPITVNIKQGNWDNTQYLRGDTLSGRFISNGHYTIEKHFVLAPLLPIFLSMMSCVNSKPFRDFGPWTLLMQAVSARKTHTMQGAPAWTFQFKLGYNPNTWNAVYRGETQQYEFVRSVGQAGPNPGPGVVVVPAVPSPGALPGFAAQAAAILQNAGIAVQAQPAGTITLSQPQNLTLPDGTSVPIITRGPGIPAGVTVDSNPTSINIQATDYGLIYPVCDFSLIDTFF